MADISDVTAYLKGQALAAVYPNGVGTKNSIVGLDVRLMEGWPIGAQLELDLQGLIKDPVTGAESPRADGIVPNVSVFPSKGGGRVDQILDQTYTITPAAINLTASLSNDTITVSGTSAAGEFITVIADDAYIYSETGTSAAAIISALATAAQANYPGTTSTSSTLTIPVGHSLVMRQGGQAVLGKVTHKQRQPVMVTVWAPTPAIRTTLATAIDNLIKQTLRPSMPDTSQALVCYDNTYITDEQQTVTIYRRDLIYDVEYATVEQFPGYTITSTQVSIINAANSAAVATAIE